MDQQAPQSFLYPTPDTTWPDPGAQHHVMSTPPQAARPRQWPRDIPVQGAGDVAMQCPDLSNVRLQQAFQAKAQQAQEQAVPSLPTASSTFPRSNKSGIQVGHIKRSARSMSAFKAKRGQTQGQSEDLPGSESDFRVS